MPHSLLRATVTVGGMTLVSRVLGFVRDMVLARAFGASPAMDAFLVAFRIPNLLRRFFAEGAFAQAFVPVLAEYKAQGDRAVLVRLIDRVAGTLAAALGLVTLLGMVAAPLLVSLFAPGFHHDPAQHGLAADLLRITFPYLFFIALTAFAGGILNTHGQFAIPALTPVWLNITLIVAALAIAPRLSVPITALAWGVSVAGVLQLAFQWPFLQRLRLLPRPRWGARDPGVRRILCLMGPAVFGSSVAQINILFDTLIASLLVSGSVSWLYYADRMVEFPLGIFGIALGTVILPRLAHHHADAATQAFSHTLDWALRWVVLLAIPAGLAMLLCAEPVLITLLGYGAFDRHDTHMSGLALSVFGLGVFPFIGIKILAPGFYARQDTRTPVRIGVIALLSNMILNVLFVGPLVFFDHPAPHAGIAFATVCSAYLNAGLLYRHLRRTQVYIPEPGWAGLSLRVVLASLVLAAVLIVGRADPDLWLGLGAVGRVIRLGTVMVLGAGAYFAVLRLTGLKLTTLARPSEREAPL